MLRASEASAAEAGATRDLSELEPRPVKDAAANVPSASPDGFLNWIRGSWWKLAVLLACGWAAVRLWQALRANWFFRQYAEDPTERTITRR